MHPNSSPSELSLSPDHETNNAKIDNHMVAVTINLTSQSKNSIDWEKEVIEPTAEVIKLFRVYGIKFTLMADMVNYFWLKENHLNLAQKYEQLLTDCVREGGDVQLLIDSNSINQENIDALLKKSKFALELILRKINPDFMIAAVRFRASWKNSFKQIYNTLVENRIVYDSSINSDQTIIDEISFEFFPYYNHQPYFANPYDPNLKPLPSEKDIVEIPVFQDSDGKSCLLDAPEGSYFASNLLTYIEKKTKAPNSSKFTKLENIIKSQLGNNYWSLKRFHKWINRFLPRRIAHYMTFYEEEKIVKNSYFVIEGYPRIDMNIAQISSNLESLVTDKRFTFLTLSEIGKKAKLDLQRSSKKTAANEADNQVQGSYSSILCNERNENQSYFLQDMIPLDGNTVLDLGCGAGYWSKRISNLYPWMKVVGVDWGKDFIDKAIKEHASENVSFQIENFEKLSFPDNHFNCVYADNVLEHAYNIDQTLQEVFRVLAPGGILVGALPSDARNPKKSCIHHNWKTVPHEIRLRLENAGFFNIEVKEIDTFLNLGMPPYPPSNDKMCYISARKYKNTLTPLERAVQAMNWVYNNLSPDPTINEVNPIKVIKLGRACNFGYTAVLGYILKREGFDVSWATMYGHGSTKNNNSDAKIKHEIIQLKINGEKVVLDPTINLCFKHSLDELLKNPSLSNISRINDKRYIEFNYHALSNSDWYGNINKYSIHNGQNKGSKLLTVTR
jgi:ubiquinone/menaquinone biosynthesis C-methylase UbiE